ncbi:MAG: hypothetical protein PHE24_07030 [Patescibacteria group bacterium]|nr:hypothetical protein [Patescibacteria group bacterium]
MNKKTGKDFKKDAAYWDLISSLKKIMDEAFVKGVDFNREHLLNCFSCECFEGFSKEGSRCVFRKDGSATGLDVDFKVLDVKRRDYVLKKGGLRWRTTYHYICGLCGTEQKVCHVDEFGPPPKN